MQRQLTAFILLLVLSPCTSSVIANHRASTAQVVDDLSYVTFTFNSPCDDCSTQSGPSDNRFFVDVPAGNNPSLSKSNSVQGVNLEIQLRNDRLIYVIVFKPGTAPRAVWRNGGKLLQVFYVPVTQVLTAGDRPTSPLQPGPVALSTDPRRGATPTAPTVIASTEVVGPSELSRPQATPAATPSSFTKPVNRDEEGSTALAAVDLSVPESPAFTVLGVTPETVIRPTSPRAFATSLLNGVDTNGNFQSGLAMDFVPYLLLAGDELTLRKYQTQPIARLLARTQFSFATTKGASEDDKSLRLALGLHVTLFDKGDPRTDEDLMTCFSTFRLPPAPTQLECELPDNPTAADREAFRRCQETFEAAKEQRAQQVQEVVDFNNDVSTRCRNEAQKRNWNRSSWIVGAAPSWISTDGQTKNLGWNGGGFWTSLAYGFEGVPGMETRSQLIFHARYRNREQVPDPNITGRFLSQDTMFFGSRFRHGSPNFNGSFEYSFLRSRINGHNFDNSGRLALGFERRIAGDTWFNLALGGETGRADGRNNGFVLTSFKWAFSDRRNVPSPQ